MLSLSPSFLSQIPLMGDSSNASLGCHILVLHLVPVFSGVFGVFLDQLYNWAMLFRQHKLPPAPLTSSLLRTHFGTVCLSDSHLRQFFQFLLLWNPFFFYLLQLIFATSLFTLPLSAWCAKWMHALILCPKISVHILVNEVYCLLFVCIFNHKHVGLQVNTVKFPTINM